MDIKFIDPGIDYMLQSIMEFQKEDTTPFWSDSLYQFYPFLDKEYAGKLTYRSRKQYIEEKLTDYYQEIKGTIQNKIQAYYCIGKRIRRE